MDVPDVPPPPPLLRLPPHLRRRIYLATGLVPSHWDGLPVLLSLHGDFDTSRTGRSKLGNSTLGTSRLRFHGLLLSCRAIYAEASALLYSMNRFVIRMPPDSPHATTLAQGNGLAPLRALRNSSLASLRHLKIVVSEASCHARRNHFRMSWCCDYRLDTSIRVCDCERLEKVTHEGPLRAGDPFTESTLSEWRSTAAVLASRGVSLANLELAFVCDVPPDQPELAGLAAAPLASLAPLKDCHVRLCRRHRTEIQEIADEAVLCARGTSLAHPAASSAPTTSSCGSRLLALPRELRLRILEHTDLIAPWGEVTWDRRLDEHPAGRTGGAGLRLRGMVCAQSPHHGCRFSACYVNVPDPSVGCFCRLAHSASSPTCRCWGPPLALFLVCRGLSRDAQVVFFSGNRFVVHDYSSLRPWLLPPLHPEGGYPMARFAISVFLRDIVPTPCLSLLRFVEMVFPAYPHDSWPQNDDPALEDWAACVGWLKDKIDPPALTMRLYMGGMNVVDPESDRLALTKEEGQEILKAYARILRPLSELGGVGLARFYAHFEWPWKYASSQAPWQRVEANTFRRVMTKETVLKQAAEQWVMGERHDTLYVNGKEPPESMWKTAQ